MSAKSERKKAIKAQKQIQESTSSKVAPVKFEGFDLSHDEQCSCNLETIDTIETLMIEAGFVEVPCKYSDGSGVPPHSVYIPENFESTCSSCQVKVWIAYANFAKALFEAGLTKNFNSAYACIREYVEKGPDSKCYFHPDFEETPFGEDLTATEQQSLAEAKPAA